MGGKLDGKREPEFFIALAAWLSCVWPCLAFPDAQIDPGVPVTAAYPSSSQYETPPFQTGGVSTSGGSKNKIQARAGAASPDAPADGNVSTLQLPPIRFWGDFGYEMRRDTIDAKESMLQSYTTRLNASTFIWRPWFAQASGGLGFTTSTATGAADSRGASNFVTGNAALNLLPYSRFPFEAHLDRSDSRLSSGLGAVTSVYRTTRFGLSQRYRPPAGGTQYMASYDRNLWESADFGQDRQDTAHFDMTRRFANQTFQISGDTRRNERPLTQESAVLNSAVARHSYAPSPSLSVESLASMTKTNYRLVQGESDFSNLQLSSFAFWRPTGKPLTVTAGARLFGFSSANSFNSGAAAPASRQSGANVNLGGVYEFSRNIRLNASGNVNMTENNGVQTLASNQSAGVSYQADAIALGAFRYTKYASGTLTNRNDPRDSGQHFAVQAGHGLNRNLAFGGGSLGLNINQSVSTDFDTHAAAAAGMTAPAVVRLSHSGSLTWSLGEGMKTTFVRISASDSRALNGARDTFQLLNLQASRNESFSRNASLSGNMTIQMSRQKTHFIPFYFTAATPATPYAPADTSSTIATTTVTSSVDVSYRHQRAFGVRRLRYVSELRIYGDAPLPVLASPQEQESRSWENRLDYSIGRLQLRLRARISEVNAKRNSLLMFTLNRQFGEH